MTRVAIACLLAAACSDEAPSLDGPTLPSNAYFIYERVDECLAQASNPYSCAYAVALCHTGRVGERIGDLITEGEYELDGPIARGVLHEWVGSDHAFELDVSSGAATGLALDHYVPDLDRRWETLQFDTISCDRPR